MPLNIPAQFTEVLTQWTMRQAFELALGHFYLFTLVVMRLAGLMTIGPLFGQALVPVNIRVLLVLSLSFVITPTLTAQLENGFHRLDANGDGQLTADEVPDPLRSRLLNEPPEDERTADAPRNDLEGEEGRPVAAQASVTFAEYTSSPRVPRRPGSALEYAWVGGSEFAIGLVLGLGVFIILSGIQLAGSIIDQQSGVSLGEIANPAFELEGSATGQFLYMMAVVLILVMEPTGAHLLMIASLVESFQTLPAGDAFVSHSAIELLRDLVHQSLVLGVQAAAPMLAVMTLVGLTMGVLGHTVPQINILVVGFPVRAFLSLLVLILSISGVARRVVDAVPVVIDDLRHQLTFL